MIEYLPIALTFLLLLCAIRWTGFLPFPTGLIVILGISQILFALAHHDKIHYNMLDSFNLGGLDAKFDRIMWIYTSIAFFSFAIFAGKYKSLKAIKLDRETIVALSNADATLRFVIIAVGIVIVHLMLYALTVNWHKLWFHRLYLQPLYDISGLTLTKDKIASSILGLSSLFAILSVVCFCVLHGSRSVFFKVVAGLTSLCYFTILLAVNSRSAAIVPALAALFFYLLQLRGRSVVVPVMGFLTILAITSALNGRSTYEHGISRIPDHFAESFASDMPRKSEQVLLDCFQGIFVTAESLQITDSFRSIYKMLSFSPLPSFIDHFSSQRKQNERQLGPTVPMSGLGEAINFGWRYVVLLFAILTVVARMQTRLVARSPVVFLMCNFLLMFCVYVLMTYPVRNGLRYAVLSFIIASFELFRTSSARNSKRSSVRNAGRGPVFFTELKPPV